MKTFFIIHGIQGHAGKHWQAWLKKELEKSGHKVIMQSFPNPNRPDRSEWLEFLKTNIEDINIKNLVFITHSLGAVTAMDLSLIHIFMGKMINRPLQLRKLIQVPILLQLIKK